jgi:hypothetical protein
MEMSIMTLGFVLVGLCIFVLFLLNKVSDLSEQNYLKDEVIMNLATELQDLGSPNVRVMRNEKTS